MTFYEYSGMVAGALITMGVLFRTIIYPIHRWATRLEKAVSHVEMNMKNNGGSSLRDAIDRIEKRLSSLEDHVTKPK